MTNNLCLFFNLKKSNMPKVDKDIKYICLIALRIFLVIYIYYMDQLYFPFKKIYKHYSKQS